MIERKECCELKREGMTKIEEKRKCQEKEFSMNS